MSALCTRANARSALVGLASMEFQNIFGNAPSPILATFVFDHGEVSFAEKLRNTRSPFFEIAKLLREESLEGILLPDIEVLLPSITKEPYLAFHIHALLISTKPKIRLKRTANLLAEKLGWSSRLPETVTLRGKRPGTAEFTNGIVLLN